MMHLKSLADTKAFAEAMMKQVKPGTVIALEGDLGAGKTTFVKYCAQALGVQETIDSPTFILLKTYGPPRLHHIDAYRLEGGYPGFEVDDAINDPEAIVFVEWASYIQALLPKDYITLHFTYVNDQERMLTINDKGFFNAKKLFNH